MPRELSTTLINAMMGRSTGLPVLYLLDIEHEDLESPLRIVNNTEDVLSEGNLYTAMGFELRLPEERDATPRGARISIDNTSQWLTPVIRSLSGEFEVTIKVATPTDLDASPPVYDNIEFAYLPMQLIAVEYNGVTVQGTLSYENLANQPFPGDVFGPFEFPGMF